MISLIANLILPFLIFFIILYGLLKKKEMYDPFLKGVSEGFRIVAEVAPTLIALFFAVQIFRSSGALELLVQILSPAADFFQIPTEVLPVIFAKLFSSSAAAGFLLDIFKNSGPDSAAGFLSSIILSSTETCFYIMSIYYSSVHIKKTRHTLCGALLATFAGIAASVILCRFFYF